MSSNFAAAASTRKEGENTFVAKVGAIEEQLRKSEKHLLESQVS